MKNLKCIKTQTKKMLFYLFFIQFVNIIIIISRKKIASTNGDMVCSTKDPECS